MFDLRTEAEMRLHSEKVARELAVNLKKQRDEGGEHTSPETTVTTDAERDG